MNSEKSPKSKKSFRAGFLCGFLCCIFLAFAGLGGQYLYDHVFVHIYQRPAELQTGDIEYDSALNERSYEKIAAIETIIRDNYFQAENITGRELETGLYRGIVDALGDPYSAYYSAEELITAQSNIEGIFYGIGAYISYDEVKRLAVISGIIEGGSAAESDLREGDFIVKVDDVDVTDFTGGEVVSLVRGQENTPVRLTVYREGVADYLVFDLLRKKALEKTTVRHGLTADENIGYIHITEFDNVTVSQFTEALEELKDHGIRGLILDLRSNPGGNVSSVTAIARQILPKGLIVYTQDREGKRVEYTCDGNNELKLPLTVLVNEYSASAAEILAGAIQDHQKGTVIGEKTYGKGVVQQIINMSDNTAVKLTVSSYFTPLGRSLGGSGIVPDLEIALDRNVYYEEGIDSQLDMAIEVLTEKIY